MRTSDPIMHGKVPALDGLRALAVAFVIWHHAGHSAGVPQSVHSLGAFVPSAKLGVRVFFVISGFIITLLLMREWRQHQKIDLGHFYVRRAFRILPALAVYLCCSAMLQMTIAPQESALEWLTTLTFTKNLFGGQAWLSGHLWSLSVEEQFYLIWPGVVALGSTRWRIPIAWLLIPSAIPLRYLLLKTGHIGFSNVSPFTNIDWLMVGALAAMFLAHRPPITLSQPTWHGILLAAAATTALAAQGLDNTAPLWSQALCPTVQACAVGTAIVATVHLRTGPVARLLNARPIAAAGMMSYSLYLWQQPLLVKPGFYTNALGPLTQYPYNVAAACLLAYLSYHLIERPCLGIRHQLEHRQNLERSTNVI